MRLSHNTVQVAETGNEDVDLQMSRIDSIREIPNAEMAQMYRLWDDARGDAAMPARKDMDPFKLPGLMPNMYLLEVLDHGEDFLIRVVGSNLAQIYDADYTGRKISEMELSIHTRKPPLEVCREPVAAGAPILGVGNLAIINKGYMTLYDLKLPLSTDGTTVDYIWGYNTVTS